jgi:hypothetical protein
MTVGGCIGGFFAGGFFILLCTLWSAATLYFDYTCVNALIQQHRANSYSSTQGRVLESRVDVHYDSDGNSYTAIIKYAYTVKGREYINDKLRYGTKSGGKGPSEALAAKHPSGSTLTIYYDPLKPSDSVLQVGIGGTDLFMIIFLIPFNAIMFGTWYFGYRVIRGWLYPPPAGGVKIIETALETRVRLPERHAFLWAAGAGTLNAFVFTFILAFAFDSEPSPAAAIGTLLLTLGVSATVYLKVSAPVRAGSQDLVIDEHRQRVVLPCTQKRTFPIEIPYANLRRVEVELEETPDGEGGVNKAYLPVLVYRENDAEKRERVTSFSDEQSANSFADWLRNRLKLALPATANGVSAEVS